MKKIYLLSFLVCSLLAFSLPVFADNSQFNVSLQYGSTNTAEVLKLQNFLHDLGYLKVTPTGAFLSLTKQAVVDFQTAEGVNPTSGYFGPLTRAVANQKILAMSSPATISIESVSGANSGLANAIGADTKIVNWKTSGYPLNAGVNINLLRMVSTSPVSFTVIRSVATDTANDGQESLVLQNGENSVDVYIEITCSSTYNFKSGCKSEGGPVKVN